MLIVKLPAKCGQYTQLLHLGIELSELFKSDDASKDVNSYDKSLIEKLSIIDKLDDKEKQAFYSILDALISKKRMKDTLSSAIGLASKKQKPGEDAPGFCLFWH